MNANERQRVLNALDAMDGPLAHLYRQTVPLNENANVVNATNQFLRLYLCSNPTLDSIEIRMLLEDNVAFDVWFNGFIRACELLWEIRHGQPQRV